MSLQLYFDSLSQPCRAVEIFLKVNNIKYIPKKIEIAQGMQRTDKFKEISPFQKLPVIEHNGNHFIESIAIMRYLCREYNLADHWYPKDSLKQMRIEEYLAWHQSETRVKCYTYVWVKTLDPILLGRTHSEKKVKYSQKQVDYVCDCINNIWLKQTPFIASSEISIADLAAATELQQLSLVDYDPGKERPALSNWMERVRSITNPAFDLVHEELVKFNKVLKESSLSSKL